MDHAEQLILQRKLARFLVDEVFNTVDENDLLIRTAEGVTYKGKTLSIGQVKVLRDEAVKLLKTNLFEVLIGELLFHAKRKHNEATTELDLIASKNLAYLVDMLKSKVKKI